MSVKLTGDWGGVLNGLRSARNWLIGPTQSALMGFGKEITAEIQRRMMDNPGPPLAEKTVKRKRRERRPHPQNTWLETLWLRNHGIAPPKLDARWFGRSSLSIEVTTDKHPGSGLPAARLWEMLEKGGKGKKVRSRDSKGRYLKATVKGGRPPRPIFAPLLADIEQGRIKAIENLRKHLHAQIKLI